MTCGFNLTNTERSTPRNARIAITGCPHHVVNRGNDRRRLFSKAADYRAFLRLLRLAKDRYPVKVFGVCLMPNHFHAVLQPESDGALSSYVQWVLGRYACDLRSQTQTTGHGHVFQRRFWSNTVADVGHFLCVLRYVEANPSRAALVERAEDWPWSSLALRRRRDGLLDPLPISLPHEWVRIVNAVQPGGELDAIRCPVRRGRPPVRLNSLTPSTARAHDPMGQ